MKKIRIANNITMIGKEYKTEKGRMIDYYFEIPRKGLVYVFTGTYKEARYKLVKDKGIRVNDLLAIKTKCQAVMKLVERTKRYIPYMVKEYELPVAA